MNETIRNILARRSVRSFTEQPVKQSDLEEILQCGAFAPSSNGCQAWHFTVLTNRDKLDQIAGIVRKHLQAMQLKNGQTPVPETHHFCYHAPAAILIAAPKAHPYAAMNCAAAIQNMMVAATSLGLGSCWVNQLNLFSEEEDVAAFVKEVGVPEGYKVFCVCALGYAAGEPKPAPRKEDVMNWAD